MSSLSLRPIQLIILQFIQKLIPGLSSYPISPLARSEYQVGVLSIEEEILYELLPANKIKDQSGECSTNLS